MEPIFHNALECRKKASLESRIQILWVESIDADNNRWLGWDVIFPGMEGELRP
jgi:hypothetical protein